MSPSVETDSLTAAGAWPAVLTLIAMLAFAANSVLCRLALGEGTIDPYAFTSIRIGSGAAVLFAVTRWRARSAEIRTAPWRGPFLLLVYAFPFSLAYVRIGTAAGALLLFGSVQVTMIVMGLRSGERPSLLEWVALAGAGGGLLYLVSPGLSAPDPVGAALMVLAGVGWGAYSMAGKGAGDPTGVTARNFGLAALFAVPAALAAAPWLTLSGRGVLLAVASGALASGLGYTIWYAALKSLTSTRAALVQLSVPVLAAAGGVLIVGEVLSKRLVVASCVILLSIALGILSRRWR